MAVRINLEIGHEASIRNKRTQEGFTHDWEVFVRGCDGTDIQYYVDKVVFYLHETFNKPKRVFKEPPYSIKESGYAGFVLPIEIHLKNKDEPKKIKFSYDLTLQPSGPAIYKVQKEKYVFSNPTDDFKHKLLKGGGTIVNSSNSLDMNDLKSNSEDKNQLLNKPKLGGSDMQKKYKTKSDDGNINFHNLFGTPIKKSSKISPDPAKGPKETSKLSSSSSKDRGDKDKLKNKSPNKDKDKDRDRGRAKDKESSSERKNREKTKDRNKERDRSSSKREKSPRPRSSSPKRLSSPKRPEVQSPLPKHEDKQRSIESVGKTKDEAGKTDKKYKKYSEKYKDSGKEHKKESSKVIKDGAVSLAPVQKELSPKIKDRPKELVKDAVMPKDKESSMKSKDKVEEKKEKHKHKKKDKDKREKSKEDRHKSERSSKGQNNVHNSKYDATKETDAKANASPEPQPPAMQVQPPASAPIVPSALSKSLKQPLFSENENSNSSLSSKEETVPMSYPSSAAAVPAAPKPSESLFDSLPKDQPLSDKTKPKKDKSRKKDKKSDKEEKKRKRKHENNKQTEDDEPETKHFKASAAVSTANTLLVSAAVADVDSDGDHRMSSAHASRDIDKENQENPEEYMKVLRELQHKIMTLQDNSKLQRVVQLIAETGRYEVSARTFDFDLCLLERSTVRRLQEFFSLSSS